MVSRRQYLSGLLMTTLAGCAGLPFNSGEFRPRLKYVDVANLSDIEQQLTIVIAKNGVKKVEESFILSPVDDSNNEVHIQESWMKDPAAYSFEVKSEEEVVASASTNGIQKQYSESLSEMDCIDVLIVVRSDGTTSILTGFSKEC
jgi:hypothetical protein